MEPPKYELRIYRFGNGRSPFSEWLDSLHDKKSRAVILKRIGRLNQGNFGKCRDLREGVWELKIAYGPGFRVYFSRVGKELILLLLGGDKSSQSEDIRKAKAYLDEYKNRR